MRDAYLGVVMTELTATKNGDDLVKALAWEVSRNVIDHHRWVYSKIFENAPSTFQISLRNSIYNQIASAIKCHTEDEMRQWIASSEDHRRTMRKITTKNKRKANP